jgi:hypothetical protein
LSMARPPLLLRFEADGDMAGVARGTGDEVAGSRRGLE